MEDGEQQIGVAERGTQPSEIETVDPARAADVSRWCERIRKAKTHEPFVAAWKRMRESMEIAKLGGTKEWVENKDNYTVPIAMRHINKTVADLYAKNPTAQAKRRKRLDAVIWDGKPESYMQAMQMLQSAMVDPMMMANPMMATALPQAQALVQEVEGIKQQNRLYDRIGETLVCLFDYYMNEPDPNFKLQMKAAVRRAKVCGVAFVTLDFQRLMEKRPELSAQIEDITGQLAHMERLANEAAEGEIQDNSADMHELRTMLETLQSQAEVIVREGPVWDFPRSTEIIVDPNCRSLKGFVGADWVAREFHMSADEVKEVYDVDVGKLGFTSYGAGTDDPENVRRAKAAVGEDTEHGKVCVWRVFHKRSGHEFTIADGCKDYLREPKEPVPRLERFWNIFTLSFNDIEDEKDIYPPPDPWLLRHPQQEYNTARQGLKEHRRSNRPFYFAQKGRLEEEDKRKLSDHEAHAIVEVSSMETGMKPSDLVQRAELNPIDPALYEVNSAFEDVLRTVGTQEALMGGVSGGTATESSIAEQGRISTISANVDDLDEFLTEVARATGQLMLLEVDEATAKKIAGEGAVWPALSREDIVAEIFLSVKAGSSGRPNKAAEIANRERAFPFIIQIPGSAGVANAMLTDYLELLDIDYGDAVLEGLPSIVALNALASRPPAAPGGQVQPGTGDSNDPQSQGDQGGQNAPRPGAANDGPQPAYPAGPPGLQ